MDNESMQNVLSWNNEHASTHRARGVSRCIMGFIRTNIKACKWTYTVLKAEILWDAFIASHALDAAALVLTVMPRPDGPPQLSYFFPIALKKAMRTLRLSCVLGALLRPSQN